MRLFLIIFLLLGLICCRPKTERPPGNLLGKEQMVSVLIRIHLLEADLAGKNISNDSSKAIFKREEKKIFRDLKVEEERFRVSYDFYLKHPEYLDIIYTTIVDSLGLRESIVMQREMMGDTTAMPSDRAQPATPR